MDTSRKQNKKRIKELEKLITQARHDYYNEQSTISDQEFDALVDELEELDPNNKAVTSIGAPVVSEWKKVSHPVFCGSLNKINSEDQLRKFVKDNYIEEIFIAEKLDGISILTTWENGKLVLAATRGSGDIGEDITVNVKKMHGIPEEIPCKDYLVIRGEIILKHSMHRKYFKDAPNVRNIASGTSKRYDGKGTEHLHVLMYTVADGRDFKTETEQFDFLQNQGFYIPNTSLHNDVESAIEKYKKYADSIRKQLDYDIDGLVCRENNISKQIYLGETNGRPKGAVAFKFENEGKVSTIIDIIPQTGNTGVISPVGVVNKVQLVGAEVERASLYNYGYINRLGLDIGAEVLIVRANDVIPRIEKVTKSTGTIADYPRNCPECGAETRFNGEYLICPNSSDCPAQSLGRLKIWIREQGILDWGPKVLQRLLEAGLVEDVGGLYRLSASDMVGIERMGQKLAEKLVRLLNEAREIPLANFLGGLGISGVGTSSIETIVNAGYDSLEKIQNMSIEEIDAIDGFGYITSKAFYYGLKKNKTRIDDILDAGVKIKEKPVGSLSGKSFCISGSLPSGKKKAEVHKIIESLGGIVKKNVSKDLSYLICEKQDSNKANTARKYGTKTISEEEFMRMVD